MMSSIQTLAKEIGLNGVETQQCTLVCVFVSQQLFFRVDTLKVMRLQ